MYFMLRQDDLVRYQQGYTDNLCKKECQLRKWTF